jgi:hypothetical protein
MLIFMIMEIGVFFDAWLTSGHVNEYVVWYFGVKIVLCVMQAIGMWLVAGGRYRLGGTLQIVASAIHVVELMGLVGVYGGLQAYRYPEQLASREKARADSVGMPAASV